MVWGHGHHLPDHSQACQSKGQEGSHWWWNQGIPYRLQAHDWEARKFRTRSFNVKSSSRTRLTWSWQRMRRCCTVMRGTPTMSSLMVWRRATTRFNLCCLCLCNDSDWGTVSDSFDSIALFKLIEKFVLKQSDNQYKMAVLIAKQLSILQFCQDDQVSNTIYYDCFTTKVEMLPKQECPTTHLTCWQSRLQNCPLQTSIRSQSLSRRG